MKIGMISLGCDKNRVDSENMLYLLKNAGYLIVDSAERADVVIVNTCAFIDEAKKEAIDTILEMAALKGKQLQKLIVTGCFAQRYGKIADIPEVDLFLDIKEEKNIVGHVEKLIGEKAPAPCADLGRIITTPAHYAYLKIADGCNNRCAFCAIPLIRGPYVSRPIEELADEARALREQGVKELILVAQDTTNYGVDLYCERKLKALLRELVKTDFWKIRILYAYPELIDEELLELISKEDRIAKYLDIPLQHIDGNILRKMNRRSTEESIRKLVTLIREKYPMITLRSTFITGFPYEGEKEHKKLLSFIDGSLDYAGFFVYSPEEDTPAYNYPERVSRAVAKKRKKELEKVQSLTTVNRQKKYVGEVLSVIYEGIDYDRQRFYGRTEFQAPGIDTRVLFTSDFPLEVGNIYNVLIESADFDLAGKTVPAR
ncbi:MAG TPA: 30S ribosomal protein S12 methylthiotransferase RimO [Clostridia bacterium]|jgi:ribosomal protein S12 methylthiotransferase|nr:30S ribosomal protein S12 methylthiotransferase RimO [Clostridia bacterium]